MGGCGTLVPGAIGTISRKPVRRERPRPVTSAIPHLRMQECAIRAGNEWLRSAAGWLIVQARVGSGYWVGSPESLELPEGGVLVLSAQAQGVVRASVLGGLVLRYFALDPARLVGLFTLSELQFLQAARQQQEFAARVFPPDSTVAMRVKSLENRQTRGSSLERLNLIQVFVESFPDAAQNSATAARQAASKARERLESFLRETTTADLLQVNLPELARLTGCTPRHLNRIFNELVGMSFRQKHTELRLARACELLADTEAKVVDVALESGYQSLSLFNLMFARRFGVSPGQWRKSQREGKAAARPALAGAGRL
jgi:AraC-like DNA-binding protein